MTATLLALAALLALGAYLFGRGILFRPESVTDWKQEALTRMAGAAFEPALSPDGQSFAFVHDQPDGTAHELMVCNKNDAAPRTISTAGADAISPAWSPDGASIAYLRAAEGSMQVVTTGLKTSKTRVLTGTFPTRYELNGRHLDWSPDGRLLVVDDKTKPEDPFSLYLVSTADGRKARLTFPTMDVIGDLAPRFSPDGKSVAFIRMIYQHESELFVIPTTGGEARKITSDDAVIGDVDWLRNSETLLFSSARGGTFGFWKIDAREHAANPVAFHAEISSDVPLQFSVAKNANEVAYSAYAPNLDIMALDLSAAESGNAKWTRRVDTWKEESMPQFSPDGQSLAYISDVGGTPRIRVGPADGLSSRPVTPSNVRPSYYRWSPDNLHIVYTSVGRPGFQIIHVLQPSNIYASFLQCGHPSYSWDGQSIYCQSGVFLSRVPLKAGTAQPVTDQGGFPVAATDGDSIYYAGGRIDPNIWRLRLTPGSHPEAVVTDLLSGYWGCWSLTSSGIYYLGHKGNEPWIVFRSNAGAIRQIARFPTRLPPIGVSTFSMSEQRRELVVVSSSVPSANLQELVW